MRRVSVLLLLLLTWTVLLAAAVLPTRRLHGDEAFFLTFARRAAVGGDWWLTGALDKPPLTLYANALALNFFAVDTLPNGVLTLEAHKGEFAGRLFSAACAMLGLAALWRVLRQEGWSPLVASMGLLPVPLLPQWQLYGASAFMDMPMLAFALCGWLWARRGRGAGAGVWLALALWAKPQGALFAPLVLVAAWQSAPQQALRALLSASVGGLALLAWDTARAGESIFTLGAANNLLRAAPIHNETAFVLWLVSVLLVSLSLLVGGRGVLVGIWCAGYLALHLFGGITFYERYLLPVWVLLWVMGLGVLAALWRLRRAKKRSPRWRALRRVLRAQAWGVLLLSFLLLTQGYRGGLTQQQDYSTRAFDRLADALNALPEATAVYYHQLGWELSYYMGQWTNKRLTHYDTSAAFWADFVALDEISPRAAVGIPRYWVWNEAFAPQGWTISERNVAGFAVFLFTYEGK